MTNSNNGIVGNAPTGNAPADQAFNNCGVLRCIAAYCAAFHCVMPFHVNTFTRPAILLLFVFGVWGKRHTTPTASAEELKAKIVRLKSVHARALQERDSALHKKDAEIRAAQAKIRAQSLNVNTPPKCEQSKEFSWKAVADVIGDPSLTECTDGMHAVSIGSRVVVEEDQWGVPEEVARPWLAGGRLKVMGFDADRMQLKRRTSRRQAQVLVAAPSTSQ